MPRRHATSLLLPYLLTYHHPAKHVIKVAFRPGIQGTWTMNSTLTMATKVISTEEAMVMEGGPEEDGQRMARRLVGEDTTHRTHSECSFNHHDHSQGSYI